MNDRFLVYQNFLFKLGEDGTDYWVSSKFNDGWHEVEYERGPHPSYDFTEITENEALEFALSLGMTQEDFYGSIK